MGVDKLLVCVLCGLVVVFFIACMCTLDASNNPPPVFALALTATLSALLVLARPVKKDGP